MHIICLLIIYIGINRILYSLNKELYEIRINLKYLEIINLLENMLHHKIDIPASQLELENLLLTEFKEILSNLDHYFSDEDIRKKDSEYSNFQNNELLKLIHYFKIENIEKANTISFLEDTPNI